MSPFWVILKGSVILQAKALPRILVSPFVGAVRGAFVTTWNEMAKTDAEIAAYQARCLKELEESGNC